MSEANDLIYLGETNFRGDRMRFGIKNDDRRRHMYVVGSTGMGKSEFLKSVAVQDIEAGHGLAFIDPHGDPSVELLDYVPEERIKDVIYFDPGDLEYPIAFNVMEQVPFEFRHLVASGLLGVFKKLWGAEVWSGRMEYILNNTILALLEVPDSTLLSINRMMADKDYRKTVVAGLKDPIVKAFWVNEFAKYADKFATEATASIQNKIGGFISNNLIRNVISQPHSTIDMRKIMDEGKILLVNISRGRIGEDASRLLGALLVTKIQLAAMSRVDIPEPQRQDFYLMVDEFQHFATESFANILSEARKFHLSLVMAHQYVKQMEEPVMDAVFGNVGSIISFRVGADDAEFLEKWFQPDFMMNDIVNLGKRQMYLRLMIDGISSRGFSASTLERFPAPDRSYKQDIIEHSRQKYATRREVVEKNIAEWAGSTVGEETRDKRQETREEWPRRFEERPRPRRDEPGQFQQRESRPVRQNFSDGGGPRRDGGRDFQREPRRDDRRPSQPNQFRQQPEQAQPQLPKRQESPPRRDESRPGPPARLGASLSDAFSKGAVDFRGKKREEQPKKEVDTAELKKILEETLGKKE